MNVLFAVHNFIGNDPVYGGTEVHVRNVVGEFLKRDEHHVYLFSQEYNNPTAYLLVDTRTGQTNRFTLTSPVTWECYRHDDFSRLAASLIARYQIDIVHFFHLIRFPLNFPLIAQQAGAKVLVACFDHYLVCRQFNLLQNERSFCGFPDVDLPTCDRCLADSFGFASGTQIQRRRLISEILFHTDALHYLCQDTKQRLVACYPHAADTLDLVMGLGLDKQSDNVSLMSGAARMTIPAGPLRVACIGNFAYQKGADLILQVMEHYAARPGQVEFRVYGDQREPYSGTLERLAKSGAVYTHGRYTPDELPTLLGECDVAMFASIWPETFALVLSEAWACGLVPVAPDLGAYGERIQHGVDGFLFAPEKADRVIALLDDLAQNREALERCRANLANVRYPSVADNYAGYAGMYAEMTSVLADPERAAQRSESLAHVNMVYRPRDWVVSAGLIQIEVPSAVPAERDPNFLRRAWGVYRRKGLKQVLWATRYYARKWVLRKQGSGWG